MQFTTGQTASCYGQGANSASLQFDNALSNSRTLTNIPLARHLGAVPAPNLARNVATITGNKLSNIANRYSVNLGARTGNTYNANANLNPQLATANIASNLASANVPAARLDISDITRPAVNSEISQRSFTANPTSILPENIASSKTLSQYRLGSAYNSPTQTYNPTSPNVASSLANINKSANRANPNSRFPNVSGNSYTQAAWQAPLANQQYGIHIEADALEIAGDVAVTGKLPFSGAISFSGRLPTAGAGSVNYACSS